MRALDDEIARAEEQKTTLDDILAWADRQSRLQYLDVRNAVFMTGVVPPGQARPIAIGNRAVALLKAIIERKDEVLFLLRAKPRHERGR